MGSEPSFSQVWGEEESWTPQCRVWGDLGVNFGHDPLPIALRRASYHHRWVC